MFRTRYIRSLMILAAAVAAACTDDPVDPVESTDPIEKDAEPASLTINFSIADLGVDVWTRTGDSGASEDNPVTPPNPTPPTGTPGALLSDDDTYESANMLDPDNLANEADYTTDENKYHFSEAALVNGSRMTCLTVILVHRRSNRIVGVRRIPDPDCPSHDVDYLSSTEDGTVHFPPPASDTAMIRRVKKNCILKANGDLAEVLCGKDGKPALDDKGHIRGLFGTNACVTFDYEEPVHIVDTTMLKECAKRKYPNSVEDQKKYRKDNEKYLGESAEKLLRGEYTILAIANYDHRVTTSSTENIGGSDAGFATLNVDETLEDIADAFHIPQNMAEGLGPFAPEAGKTKNYQYLYNLRFLMNRTLDDSYKVVEIPLMDKDGKPLKDDKGNALYRRPYIRPAVHQTLTAAKDIYLEAGDNEVNLELLRIASRTRVEVKNYAPKDKEGKDIPLQINSLEFSPNYTQSSCYLFRRNKNDRDYTELATQSGKYSSTYYTDHDGKGAPMVNYTGIYNYFNGKTYGAIVPFVNNMDSNDDDTVNDYVGVPSGEKRCIFDALMYESHLDYKDKADEPDSFTYTIDVSYPTIDNYQTPDLNKIDKKKWEDNGKTMSYSSKKSDYEYANANKGYMATTSSVDELYNNITGIEATLNSTWSNGESGEALYFFIKGVGGSAKCLYEDIGSGHMRAGEPNMSLDDSEKMRSYLWKLEDLELKDGKYYCYLKNLLSGKYMPTIFQCVTPGTNNAYMTSTMNKTEVQKYQLDVSCLDNDGYVTTSFNVTFSNHFDEPYTYKGVKYNDSYLSIWADGDYLSGYNLADRGCQFQLCPVKVTPVYVGTPRFEKTVELTTFSDATGFVEKVREIQRNDFIRILVEVSYNPDASDFEFEVNAWKTGGGDIAFH